MTDEECQYCGSEFSECTCFQTGPGVEACKEAAEKNKLEPAAYRYDKPGSIHNPHLTDNIRFGKLFTRKNLQPLFAAEDIIQLIDYLSDQDLSGQSDRFKMGYIIALGDLKSLIQSQEVETDE